MNFRDIMRIRVLLFFCFFAPVVAFSQTWQWITADTAQSYNHSFSICTDGQGNSYTATMYGLTKYNSTGSMIWFVPIGSMVNSTSVCYADNRLYFVLDSMGQLIVKQYDLNGNLHWFNYWGGYGPNGKITADGLGHLYLTGGGGGLISKMDTAGNSI